jgi:prophage antirepressor-like protein
MNQLQIIKSEHFGEITADIYSNGSDMFMTIQQLSDCLEYSSRDAIEKIISRNDYLKGPEFSATDKLSATDGKQYNTRIFTEDGIYEITMLSGQPKAKEFRAWIRKILKALRKGDAKLVSMTDYQKMMASTRAENARIRKAQILTKLATQYPNTTYQQVLNSYATKELTGEHLLPLPQLQERTYTATEIGEMLGITSNKVGILANRHNLKTDEYGAWFNDKAKHSAKEVPSFRYFENVIPVLRGLV